MIQMFYNGNVMVAGPEAVAIYKKFIETYEDMPSYEAVQKQARVNAVVDILEQKVAQLKVHIVLTTGDLVLRWQGSVKNDLILTFIPSCLTIGELEECGEELEEMHLTLQATYKLFQDFEPVRETTPDKPEQFMNLERMSVPLEGYRALYN